MSRIRIRKAKITPDLRNDFELFGKDVVAYTLGMFQLRRAGLGGGASTPTYAQQRVFLNQDPAMRWLREKRDEEERRESVSLALEIAITVLIVFEIGLSIVGLVRK
jgi:hypothetical protein